MSPPVDRFGRWLLAVAARRWRADLRAELTREWGAEMHTLAHEAGVPAGLRAWRQLRFAGSLACSRPGVRATRLRYDPADLEAAVVSGVALAGAVLAASLISLVVVVPLSWLGEGATAQPHPVAAALGYAARVAAAILLGVLVAGRVRRARPTPSTRTPGSALLVAVALLAGAVAGDAAVGTFFVLSGTGIEVALAGLVCGGLLLVPVTAAVTALARRRWPAGLAAAVAGSVLVVSTGMVAAVARAGWPLNGAADDRWWWFSTLLLVGETDHAQVGTAAGGELLTSLLPQLAGSLLVMTTVGLSYALRSTRALPTGATGSQSTGSRSVTGARPARPSGPAAPDQPAAPAGPASRWLPRLALVGLAFALLAWAVTLTHLTPNIGLPEPSLTGTVPPSGWPGWSTQEARLWMHELRLFAILCAALCLLLAGTRRGAPLLPAIGMTVLLLAAETTIARAGWAQVAMLPLIAGGALGIGAAAWWAGRWLGRRDQRGSAYRRRFLVGVAVLAVALAPGLHLHRVAPVPGVQTPAVVLLVAVGLPTLLLMLAGVAAVSAAGPALPGSVALALPTMLGVGSLTGGLLLWRDGVPPLAGLLALPLTGPLVVLVVAVVDLGRTDRPLPYLRWAGHTIASVPLAGALGYLSMLVSMFFAPTLLAPIGYERGPDGFSYVPGAFVAALLTALVVTGRRAAPAAGERAAADPPPAPVPAPSG